MPPKKPKEASPKIPKDDKKGKKGGKPTQGSLADENVRLNQELEEANARATTVETKWRKIGEKLLSGLDISWKAEHNVIDDPNFISEDLWTEFIDHLIVKKRLHEESAESLVERLEQRVTTLDMDLARLTLKCAAYEQGLKQLTECRCVDEVKDKVYKLRVIAGESFHSLAANEANRQPKDLFSILGITDRDDENAKRVIDDANRFDLVPPESKYPGSTLIQDMVPSLLLYLIKELSVWKISGADWRTLGVRVGIHQSIIDNWAEIGLELPAGRVLDEWIKGCPATVRLLYRHLMCPAMRCTVLCRRIADFYDVY